jgi:branched-chain amino acid transport system ATP-binding protein
MNTPILECVGLDAGHDGVPVVRGLDLQVGAGEVVALVGPNGAGKTTTLLTISGLLEGLGGSVRIDGRSTSRRHSALARTRNTVRRGVALVPEDRALFPGLTVREHLRLAAANRAASDAALAPFPLLTMLADRRAGLLSGGEQQMLAVARALATRPRLLLVDEMSLGLAPIVVEQLLPTVRTIARETNTGVLLVEQQVPAALAVSDRAYVLRRGHIIATGPAATLAADRDLLTASYLGDGTPGPRSYG